MATFREIIKQATEKIVGCPLKAQLLPLWRLIEWQAHPTASAAGAELNRAGDASIHLYSNLQNAPNAVHRVLVEFGSFVLQRTGETGQNHWDKKLDKPLPDQIATAKRQLESPELRQKCKTYLDLLDAYPQTGHSVDRLIFIHVVNALLANNISYPDSTGVDIETWGMTTEYAQGQKYHSLIPLTSAYAPAPVHQHFGHALAALILDDLADVRDRSVAEGLRRILRHIVNQATSLSELPA